MFKHTLIAFAYIAFFCCLGFLLARIIWLVWTSLRKKGS